MVIAFVGHSKLINETNIKDAVKREIANNISTIEPVLCYLGGYGDFDYISAVSCKELKETYSNIEAVYVTPYLDLNSQAKIKEMQKEGLCDSSIYPLSEKTLPRFAISKRNEWMVKNADLIIAYVAYGRGGAAKTLAMAKRKNKRIINIYSEENIKE